MTDFPDWLNLISDGIMMVSQNKVMSINAAAKTYMMLQPDPILPQPLIAVVRDHRIEKAFLDQQPVEVEKSQRTLRVTPFLSGLIFRDISEVRKMQQDTRELLGVLSHELRTPVATIWATLEALQSNIPAQLQEKFLSRAGDETQRLVRLLEDLTMDVRPPNYRRVYLPDAVLRVLPLIQKVFNQHAIEFVEDIQPLTLWADSDKLMQIMINLLENAAIHGPKDHKVYLKAYAVSDTLAHIVVHDEGEPLAREAFEELFKPHTRGNSVKAKGTGLGLYIVRNIAEKWHGDAWGKPLEKGNEFGFSVQTRAST